jgi:hypothetical protein
MPPLTSLCPDWYFLGTSPNNRADRFRLDDPARIIDRGLERDGNQRADAGNTHQPPANLVFADNGPRPCDNTTFPRKPQQKSRSGGAAAHAARRKRGRCGVDATIAVEALDGIGEKRITYPQPT